MTREDAVAMWMEFGQTRMEAFFRERYPVRHCNQVLLETAEDTVDGLVALGVLKIEPSAGSGA